MEYKEQESERDHQEVPSGEEETGDNASATIKNGFVPGVFAILAVICVLVGGTQWYGINSGGKEYERIQNNAAIAVTDDTAQEASKTASTSMSASSDSYDSAGGGGREQVPIDFESLQKECPDAYAWIRIPGTAIDYPVCQMVEGDQGFYLNHGADKSEDYAGAIYSENYNSRDFNDPVTVLYGHDMSNGTMFKDLHLFEDRAFFDKNREVLIYLPEKVIHYKIFAAYNYNDNHLLLNNENFEDPVIFDEFLQDILSQRSMSGFVDQNTQLNRSSRILTLSTCNAYDDQRYLVQCVLVRMGEENNTSTPASSGSTEP